MDQRALPYPARSVDIRITEQDCKYGCFNRSVAAALRHMADSLDAPGLASEFEKGTGACEFHTGIDSVLTIEWAGAVVVGYPQDIPEPENAQDHLQLVPTDEELASLTPAECAALED